MYKSFFGLKESPFRVNPDPRYLYLTKEIEEALAGVVYGVKTRKRFVTPISGIGRGKNTLVKPPLDWLKPKQNPTAFIFYRPGKNTQPPEFVPAGFRI